jgi:hypothetical protein
MEPIERSAGNMAVSTTLPASGLASLSVTTGSAICAEGNAEQA